MAGHSKFKNIMHRKGAQDARKAKIFTKIGREIVVASRLGGGDPNSNPRLRAALTMARANNMTNDRIKRAIETGTGSGKEDNYEEIRYEGYAPGGVAVIVETLTNNRNRTAGEVRSIFGKHGGNMGETNSVSFMFDRVGEIVYPVKAASGEAMFETAVEAGASDCETAGEQHIVTCAMDDLAQVRGGLEKKFGEAEKSGFVWRPNVMAPLDEAQAADVLELIEALEDDDDVQTVTTNFEVSDEIMEKLLAAG
jgi:YebC/PmpR family DNA-binding regulatory protein